MSQFELVIFQVLNSPLWLVAIKLDSEAQESCCHSSNPGSVTYSCVIWTNCLTPMCLNVSIYKMGTIIVPTSAVKISDKM